MKQYPVLSFQQNTLTLYFFTPTTLERVKIMSTGVQIALISMGAITTLASLATLGLAAFVARKLFKKLDEAKGQVEDVRSKANRTLDRLKLAVSDLEV